MGKNGIRFELAGPQHPGHCFSDSRRSNLVGLCQERNQKMGTRGNGRHHEDSDSNHSEYASTDMIHEKHGHPLELKKYSTGFQKAMIFRGKIK